jgi:hypothetical protein
LAASDVKFTLVEGGKYKLSVRNPGHGANFVTLEVKVARSPPGRTEFRELDG